MILIVILLLTFFTFVYNQLLPILIGKDVYEPGIGQCTQEDIRTNVSYSTQCSYFRSDGCDISNFRCILAGSLSNVNGSAQLINFNVIPYAALWPGLNDGKLIINVQYTDGRPFELQGVLQLWQMQPQHGNAYGYANRVWEVTYAAFVNQQTYMFNGLTSGTYVATYFDNGGSRNGEGNPEFSQVIVLQSVFPFQIQMNVKAMALDAYNTNYKRSNRNFISYQLVGPAGFSSLLNDACTNPLKNRCFVWEWRTDQGNIINAKTELEVVPPEVAADGFTDNMYKFKIFPTMCCSRRTRITARLLYSGANPLFPTQYSDYWNQRQTYGYGTDLASKILQNSRNYMDDNIPCSDGSNCQHQLDYQALVDANWNINNSTYPACVKNTGSMNTLTTSTTMDTFTVNTLRRNYCQCFFSQSQCTVYDQTAAGNIYRTIAWRSGLAQDTNNFDKYEDYASPYDNGAFDSQDDQYESYSGGRSYGFDVDFQSHRNDGIGGINAYDYSCNPYYTLYGTFCPTNTGATTITCANNVAVNGNGLFADLWIDLVTGKKEQSHYYSLQSSACSYTPGLNYGGTCNFVGPEFSDLDEFYDLPYDTIVNKNPGHHAFGPFYNTNSHCNCLSLNGDYAFDYQNPDDTKSWGSVYDTNGFTYNYFIEQRICDSCAEYNWEPDGAYGNYNHFALANRILCCNLQTTGGNDAWGGSSSYLFFGQQFSTPSLNVAAGQSPMTVYASTFWQGNIQQVSVSVNYAKITHPLFPYIQYPAFGLIDPQYVPMFPNVYGNSSNPNICYSFYTNPSNPCLLYMASTPAKLVINNGAGNYMTALLNNDLRRAFVFNTGTLLGSTGAQFVYRVLNQPTVFGVYGLDTFPVRLGTYVGFFVHQNTVNGGSGGSIGQQTQQVFRFMNVFPTYARFKVVPTVEFYAFSNIIWGPSSTYTIDISFKVLCPNLNMDTTNDNVLGSVGYCAQFFTILNQNQVPVVVTQMSGPVVSETPPTGLPFGIQNNQILGDVMTTAEFTVRILYNPANNGDTLSWYFFPKTEPEQPVGPYFCGYSAASSYSGYMVANFSVTVPDQSTRILPLICNLRSVPPACEYNQPQMLAVCFRGSPFDYAVCPAEDLPSYETTGNPLDYGRCTNYWFNWNINGSIVQGMATFAQTYNPNTTLSIFDQESVIPSLVPPAPEEIAIYPNPLVRATSCNNTNATCFMPNDDTNATGFTVVDQIHYCAIDGVTNLVILQPNLVFAPPFSFNDQVGAMYCNQTTAYISVYQQEIQTKALFGIQKQCNVSSTGYYTYTIRYGKSISALAAGEFPCYERLISYAIILTSFQADPGVLFRVPNCTRTDNCCYQLPINVFGNTGNSDRIVNLNTCNSGPHALPECKYEIVTTPNTAAAPNLCLGSTYTFTVRSPAGLVQMREQPSTGNFFQYPWRCQSSFTITLPTLGFSPIGTTVTNGDCRYEGSFLEFSFTYTNPVCTNGMLMTNDNPECQYSLWFAIEPTQVPCNCYPSSLARLAHPFLLDGANTANYNLQSIVNFPQILSDPSFTSIPDGVYTIYMWISKSATSPYYPYSNFNALVAAQPRNAIQSQVIVQFDNANGLKIIMQYTAYPQCPAKFGDNLTLTSIKIGINIRDNNYNGPYNLTLYTPTNKIINNYIIGTREACCSTCGSLSLENIYCNLTCAACDIYVQDQGLDHVFYIGTGVFSPLEQGLYYITAFASITYCTASFFPYITPINTLYANVTCINPTCYGKQNGAVYSSFGGGTQIPIFLADLIQNSDLTIATARYYFTWTGTFGSNTNLTLAYLNQTYLPFVYTGNYSLNLTDYNGCSVSASCTLVPSVTPLEIDFIKVQDANCSNQQGAVTFYIVPGTGTAPFTLYKVGPNGHVVMTSQGYILQDVTVQPNQMFFYMVCDASGCCSSMLNLTIVAAEDVQVGIIVNEYPCSSTTPSGSLTAVVNPPDAEYSYIWYRDGQQLTYIPPNANTVNGLFNGVYQVVVTDKRTNCANFAQVVLSNAANMAFTYQRQTDRNPAALQGVISGGNGSPYSLRFFPSTLLNDPLIYTITPQTASYSVVTIQQIPLSLTFRIELYDSHGCVLSVITYGVQSNPDEIIITPTPSAPPPKPPVREEPNFLPIFLISMTMLSFVVVLFLMFVMELKRRRGI